jgi:outer membrane lipoprotein-sorting protein
MNSIEKDNSKLKSDYTNLLKEKHELELNLSRKNDSNEITILEMKSKLENLNERMIFISNENESLKQKFKENLKKKQVKYAFIRKALAQIQIIWRCIRSK